MFYWKYSPTGIRFINEYYFFVPLALAGNYFIIRKIRLGKQRMKELEKLRKQLEREERIRRITLIGLGLSLGLNGYLPFLTSRGGALDFIDVNYILEECNIEEGVRYLNHNRLRKIIHSLYRHKRKGKLIFLTATALCHLANEYGLTFFDLPFAIGDFGLTSVYQTFRKALASILVGAVPILMYAGGPLAYTLAMILGASGLRLAFTNLDFIPTTLIDKMVSATDLKPRIPGQPEVIVFNNKDRITMKPVQKNPECWLPEQRVLNPKCNVKLTEIPDGSDLISPNVRYDETVNMHDVTGLDRRHQFSDKSDLGQIQSSVSNLRKGKEVNFLEKFPDPGVTDISESWDIHENECLVPEKRFLRTRNKP